MAWIESDEATVVWKEFEQPHRSGRWTYGGLEMRFDRRQYERALAEIG